LPRTNAERVIAIPNGQVIIQMNPVEVYVMSRAKMAIAEIGQLNAGASQSEQPKARRVLGGRPGAIDLAAERTALFAQVEQKLALDLDEEVQYELGRWLTMVETAKEQLLPKLLPEARVAVAARCSRRSRSCSSRAPSATGWRRSCC